MMKVYRFSDDGSLVGKIRNGGENTFEKFRIYALIKDKE